jgi:hypothetical protein
LLLGPLCALKLVSLPSLILLPVAPLVVLLGGSTLILLRSGPSLVRASLLRTSLVCTSLVCTSLVCTRLIIASPIHPSLLRFPTAPVAARTLLILRRRLYVLILVLLLVLIRLAASIVSTALRLCYRRHEQERRCSREYPYVFHTSPQSFEFHIMKYPRKGRACRATGRNIGRGISGQVSHRCRTAVRRLTSAQSAASPGTVRAT